LIFVTVFLYLCLELVVGRTSPLLFFVRWRRDAVDVDGEGVVVVAAAVSCVAVADWRSAPCENGDDKLDGDASAAAGFFELAYICHRYHWSIKCNFGHCRHQRKR
jgi:hypothetical protein